MNIYILLDRSGSMETMWGEALGSINGYVEKLKKNDMITLAAFDGMGYDIVRCTTKDHWKNVTADEISPRGSTPLYDACGRLLDRAFEDNPTRAIFIVMTDGYENCSTKYTLSQIKDKLAECNKRDWGQLFLGANFDVTKQASTLGVSANYTVSVGVGETKKFMDEFAAATMSYASGAKAADALNTSSTRSTYGKNIKNN